MNPEQWLSLKWNGGSTMSDRWLNQSKIIQYILKKRIYNAEALLQNTQYNINEIAQIIGYDNPLYFSRVFQKTKGISPSEYRKNISQRVFNSPSL